MEPIDYLHRFGKTFLSDGLHRVCHIQGEGRFVDREIGAYILGKDQPFLGVRLFLPVSKITQNIPVLALELLSIAMIATSDSVAVAGFSIDQSLLKKQRTRWSCVFPVQLSSSLSV